MKLIIAPRMWGIYSILYLLFAVEALQKSHECVLSYLRPISHLVLPHIDLYQKVGMIRKAISLGHDAFCPIFHILPSTHLFGT